MNSPSEPAPSLNRVMERLEWLWHVGEPPLANRPGLSAAEHTAAQQIAAWMEQARLEPSFDPVGNVVGVRLGRNPELPEIWLGSHIDTVPEGGRFDGALGVIAPLEVMDRMSNVSDRTIRIWAFRDEEGARFGQSCFGSRALCGQLQPGELHNRDSVGITVAAALSRLGLDASGLPPGGWLSQRPYCFVEMHIEQGPVLDRAGQPLGSVTAIAGVLEWELTFRGKRGHAGTTPMPVRADALVAASSFIANLPVAANELPGAVATAGRIQALPGAPNVIPDRVHVSLDLRAPSEELLTQLTQQVRELANMSAVAHRCEVERLEKAAFPVAAMSPRIRTHIEQATEELGLPVVRLASGAGHDAATFSQAGIPTAMLFVRSRNGGISHAPEEHTDPQDIAFAISVLDRAVTAMATV